MAVDTDDSAVKAKKELAEEKKKLKLEQREANKAARAKEKELRKRQAQMAEEREGNPVIGALITMAIVLIWLGILALLVKLDVGGFGSSVLTPILKDVKILNKILPESEEMPEQEVAEYGGYTSIKDAVEEIKRLEAELAQAQTNVETLSGNTATMLAEIERLKTFEDSQVEFQNIKLQFAEEVLYADKGPGEEAYLKYYESLDPETAQYLYTEVVKKEEVSKEIKDYVAAYSAMKPKDAAAIFNTLSVTDIDLVAKILKNISSDSRGDILAEMNEEIAAKVTRIMDPE